MAASVLRVVSRLSDIPCLLSGVPRFSWTTRAQPEDDCTQLPWSDVGSEESDLRKFVRDRRDAHSCFIFGEQHHQLVLAAQLTVLDELTKPPRSNLHGLVLEAFNVLQQPMLDAFHASWQREESAEATKRAAEALVQAYEADPGEGFHLNHYMPVFILARERRIKLYGGFPPRAWARTLAKEGLTSDLRDKLESIGFDRWSSLTATPRHRAYIRSLISGEPPLVLENEEVPIKGVVPAQVLKDAVCAFRIDAALRTGPVLAICGSGHCEYRFGVPERLAQNSLLVVTKALDEPIWQGPQWQKGEGDAIADAVVRYETVDDT